MGIRFAAPANFRIDNQRAAVLISGPQDIAIRFDAKAIDPGKSLTEYLKSGWITGLIDDTIREEQLNGLNSATAIALGEGWRFKIRVIQNKQEVYRFITAAPVTNTNLDAVSRNVTSSFKLLSPADIASLKPLRVKVVATNSGASERSIVARMRGVNNPQALFRLINGIEGENVFVPGQRYKIVTDQ